MNFLEAFDELNTLNEEALTEKLWVAINPKGSNNYYKFLTVENPTKRAADISNMLSARDGTYKQTLDKAVFNELVKELKKINTANYADPGNYSVVDIDTAKKLGSIKTLTLADRFLRQNTHKKFRDMMSEEENTDLAIAIHDAIGEDKYLIHHIDKNEDNAELSNLVLIPYSQGDKDALKVANGIHGVLHGTESILSKGDPVEATPLIFYFENGKLRVGKCEIKITL